MLQKNVYNTYGINKAVYVLYPILINIYKDLKNTWVAKKKLNITRADEKAKERSEPKRKESDDGDKPIRRKPKLKKETVKPKSGNKAKQRHKKT